MKGHTPTSKNHVYQDGDFTRFKQCVCDLLAATRSNIAPSQVTSTNSKLPNSPSCYEEISLLFLLVPGDYLKQNP